MYIDEKLIKILEPHRGETIDVSYAISLIKTIAKEFENEQSLIQRVSICSLPDCLKEVSKNSKTLCVEHAYQRKMEGY